MTDHEHFERAWSMHISGPVAECDCGKVYWDTYNTVYDWGEGEEESLQQNPKAIGVRHGVERIELEGRIFCMDCDCWHNRADRIVEWLRSNQQQIGEWFRIERERKLEAASDVPVIAAGGSV